MNLLLLNSLKSISSSNLRQLIDNSFVKIERQYRNNVSEENDSVLVCKIYTPKLIAHQLVNYQKELIIAAKKIDVRSIQIILIEDKHLTHLKHKALIYNDLESWKLYLELQYLF